MCDTDSLTWLIVAVERQDWTEKLRETVMKNGKELDEFSNEHYIYSNFAELVWKRFPC